MAGFYLHGADEDCYLVVLLLAVQVWETQAWVECMEHVVSQPHL